MIVGLTNGSVALVDIEYWTYWVKWDAIDWFDIIDPPSPVEGECIDTECDLYSAIIGDSWDGELSLDDALFIASRYGGGEFDGEISGIVAAMLRLVDRLSEVDQ